MAHATTCQAKWIDGGGNKQYHPKTTLAKIPFIIQNLKPCKRSQKFKCLHPTITFLLLLHMSFHLELRKTIYWKRLHHHKTQTEIWHESPCLDGAESDHKQSSQKPKLPHKFSNATALLFTLGVK